MFTNLIRDLVSCTFIYGLLFLFAAVFIDEDALKYLILAGWLFTIISILYENFKKKKV